VAVYATAADVRTVLARDTFDFEGNAAGLLDSTIESQVVAAQNEIDARLAGRYQVPFTTAPAVVASITIDVAAYLCNLIYRESKDLTQEDPMVLRYQRAIRLLDDLSTGKADLPGGDGSPGGGDLGAGVASVRNPYEGRLFGLETFGLGYGRSVSRRGGYGW
jgi:phage gp36-like protein